MRILVLGGSGMLGRDVVLDLRARGHLVEAPTRAELDLDDLEQVASVAQRQADWVINCAAYTAVDKAESEPDAAAYLNTLVPRYVAMACALAGSRMLHVSTDFVFDGESRTPYAEDAPTNPRSVYGRTKRDGEEAVLSALPGALVVRTSWLYGPVGRCFPRTMIGAWRAGKTLRVVADQHGCPTYTPELARVLGDLVDKGTAAGLVHACGPDATTWHAFAVRTLVEFTLATHDTRPVNVEAIETADYPTPALRPAYSVLDCSRLRELGIAPMVPLSSSLPRFVQSLAEEVDSDS